MQDQRVQRKQIPLRIRLSMSNGHTAAEPSSNEYTATPTTSNGYTAAGPSSNGHTATPIASNGHMATETPSEVCGTQRSEQIKEVLRLSNLLRADIGLGEVLTSIAASTSSCTGFGTLVICLIEDGNTYTSPVAFAGMSADDEQLLRTHPLTMTQMHTLMQPEFRISQSYFISHKHKDVMAGITVVVPNMPVQEDVKDTWHPEDNLIVPLTSHRSQKLLGFLSLDNPENGKIPTIEDIEIIELFALQAATAIDNARIFQERQREQDALEQGISELREDVERIRNGDMHMQVRTSHQKLQPIGELVNSIAHDMLTMVKSTQAVVQAVDDHTRDVQHFSELLLHDIGQQDQQVARISHIIEAYTNVIHQVSDNAVTLDQMAAEAIEATRAGQEVVDRAIDGMGKVRDTTLQSERVMKHLSESGQEVNETLNAINDLNTRMHLLALNAAIEASRAGEQGQGFIIVAQEIRKLSLSTAEATRKIGNYIRTIQQETAGSAHSVGQHTQQVVEQTELVMHTGLTFDAIDTVTQRMAGLVKNMSTTAETQVQNSRLIGHAVGEVHHMAHDIGTHMRDMHEASAHLKGMMNKLRELLGAYQEV